MYVFILAPFKLWQCFSLLNSNAVAEKYETISILAEYITMYTYYE
jgi:hypothetical protein